MPDYEKLKADALALVNEGGECWSVGDVEEAQNNFEKAFEIRKQIYEEVGGGSALMLFGDSHFDMALISSANGDEDAARDYFTKLIELREKLIEVAGDEIVTALWKAESAYEQAGEFYRDLGDDEDTALAKKYYMRAVEILEKLRETDKSFVTMNTYAICIETVGGFFLDEDDLVTARSYYEKSFELFSEIEKYTSENGDITEGQDVLDAMETKRDLAIAYKILGDLDMKNNDETAALENFEATLELMTEIAKETDSVGAYAELSAIMLEVGRLRDDIGLIQKAYDINYELSKHADIFRRMSYQRINEEIAEEFPEIETRSFDEWD